MARTWSTDNPWKPLNTDDITGFGGRVINSLNRQRKTTMQKAKTSGMVPTVWNKSGPLFTYLASRNDAHFNYVTMSVRRMIKAGLIPMTWEEFCNGYEQGDVFLLQLNGQVNVMAKLNRANKTTMAFHCPKIVQMPTWDIDGSTVIEQPAVMLGYTGIRLGKDESLRNVAAPTVIHAPVIPLDSRLDTPSNRQHPSAIWVSEIKSIRQDGVLLRIDFVK